MHHVIARNEINYFKKILKAPTPTSLLKVGVLLFNKLFSFSTQIIVPSIKFKETLHTDYKINEKNIEVIGHFTDIPTTLF